MSIILAQRHQSSLRVIEYIEDSRKTLDWYSAELKKKNLNWGRLWLPHDGAHGDFKTGKSAEQIMRDLGWDVGIVPIQPVEAGIKVARMAFGQVYIHKSACERLIQCLKRYRRGVPVSTGEPGSPVHDEWSHGADAFRYLANTAPKMLNDDMKPIAYRRLTR
jgi:phage terminase large subunit